MKRKLIIRVAIGITLSGLAIALYAFRSPPGYPGRWDGVQVGLSRDDTIWQIGSQPNDMRELKGFDVFNHDVNSKEFWQLFVFYGDDQQKVESVSFHFVDRVNGLRNITESNPDNEFRSKYVDKQTKFINNGYAVGWLGPYGGLGLTMSVEFDVVSAIATENGGCSIVLGERIIKSPFLIEFTRNLILASIAGALLLIFAVVVVLRKQKMRLRNAQTENERRIEQKPEPAG